MSGSKKAKPKKKAYEDCEMKDNNSYVTRNPAYIKKLVRIGIILSFAVLAVGLWLFAYHNRKSLDNIPSLELVIQEGEAFGHEKIQGYKREMLLEIWGEPVESGSGEDIWTIGPGSAMVRVNYNWQDEAVTLGVIPAVFEKSE